VQERRLVAALLALGAVAAGLPEAVLLGGRDLRGEVRPSSAAFAEAPALWARVRNEAGPDERVANNPNALADLTPWSVNLSWSLFAGRRSCYATWELTQVYSSLPHAPLRAIDDLFVRVFAGEGTDADVTELADRFDCRVIVVTPQDGAWRHDPFRSGAVYALVDEDPQRWRIYRRLGKAGPRAPPDAPD
jgi:hypothetical protein